MTRTPWPAGLAFLLACGPNFEPVDPPDQPGAFAVSYARFTAVDATETIAHCRWRSGIRSIPQMPKDAH